MSQLVVDKALEVLATGHDVASLRRALFATVAGAHLMPDSTCSPQSNGADSKTEALDALLARLPTYALSSIATISKGKTGIKDAIPGQYPLVVTAEARGSSDHFDFEGPGVMIPMVSSTGHGDASLKRVHYQDGQYAVGSILAVVQPLDPERLSARYLHAYLSTFKDELLVSRMVGTANVSLTVAKISGVPIPLIPISAQRKIEELMALCDRLEARQADAGSAHAQLVQALLDSLTQARDAEDFSQSWQRLAEHFHTLFTTESSIDALKQALLQLAVMGKLVPQIPDEEGASDWLERIQLEKHRLQQSRQRQSAKRAAASEIETPATKIPESWCWLSLADITLGMDSGWSPACEPTPSPSDSVWGVLKTTAVQVMQYLERENKELPSHLEPRPDAEVKAGDILFTRAGPTNRVGISCFVESTRSRLMISDKIIRFHPVEVGAYGRYIALCLNTGGTAMYLESAKSGMAASQVNISQDKLKRAPIPFPPLPEQHRIVAKVDQLMALCDQLKARLNQARQVHEQLANALVEQAVA